VNTVKRNLFAKRWPSFTRARAHARRTVVPESVSLLGRGLEEYTACDRVLYIDLRRRPTVDHRGLSLDETGVSSGSAGYCLAFEERYVDKPRISDINKRQRNVTERQKERERKRERGQFSILDAGRRIRHSLPSDRDIASCKIALRCIYVCIECLDRFRDALRIPARSLERLFDLPY